MKIYKTKKFKGNFMLDVEDLNLKDNEINIILGENGSGKSTFCKGLVLKEIKCDAKKLIILNQKPYVFNQKTSEIIESVIKWNNSNITLDDFLLKYDLINRKNSYVSELSGGEFRKLSLGLILCTKSDLLILDEPFVGIDISSQKKIIDILNKEKELRTIILVSHKLNICSKIGKFFIFMKNGKIIYTGNKEGLFNSENKYIKNFFEIEGTI